MSNKHGPNFRFATEYFKCWPLMISVTDECLWLRVHTDIRLPIKNVDHFVRVDAGFPGDWPMYISTPLYENVAVMNGSDYVFLFYDQPTMRWIVNDRDVSGYQIRYTVNNRS